MYEELIRSLRWLSKQGMRYGIAVVTVEKAADAIEELQAQLMYSNDAAKAIAEKVPKWIPVTERLPLYGQDVLAVRTYGDGEKCREVLMAHIAAWNEGTGEKLWNATNITHWMPLPEPPMEEQT